MEDLKELTRIALRNHFSAIRALRLFVVAIAKCISENPEYHATEEKPRRVVDKIFVVNEFGLGQTVYIFGTWLHERIGPEMANFSIRAHTEFLERMLRNRHLLPPEINYTETLLVHNLYWDSGRHVVEVARQVAQAMVDNQLPRCPGIEVVNGVGYFQNGLRPSQEPERYQRMSGLPSETSNDARIAAEFLQEFLVM
jgi:hypothetical protein